MDQSSDLAASEDSSMVIEETLVQHQTGIERLHQQAFNAEAGQIQQLLLNFQQDASAQPLLSLVALEQDQVVGQVVFSQALISGQAQAKAFILAPLGVLPTHQSSGIGSRLVKAGLERLAQQGADLVLCLVILIIMDALGFKRRMLGSCPRLILSQRPMKRLGKW